MLPKKPLQQVTCDVEAFSPEGFGLAHMTRTTGERVPITIPFTMPEIRCFNEGVPPCLHAF